ncbi:hypothetical protein KY332_04205 [Candidatus Woesearchaeota archaeon]|nr:hypothetical protein [Candidatus Woesearchaeota archaeon]
MQGSLSIIRLFCRDLTKELTIRQISKLIKKSYAYTNKEVWNLIKQNILNKKEIGKSIICSINLKNKKTRALLTFNSALEDHKDFNTIELKQNNVLTAFFSKNKLYIISDKKFKTPGKILTKQEFISSIKDIGLGNTPVYGYEKYWEIIGDTYE